MINLNTYKIQLNDVRTDHAHEYKQIKLQTPDQWRVIDIYCIVDSVYIVAIENDLRPLVKRTLRLVSAMEETIAVQDGIQMDYLGSFSVIKKTKPLIETFLTRGHVFQVRID